MTPSGRLYLGVVVVGLGFFACSVQDELRALETSATGTGGATGMIEPPEPDPHGGLLASSSASGAGGGAGVGGSGDPGSGAGGFQLIPGCSAMGVTTMAMSADDSNSMGSPVYAREMLVQGKAPNPALIRTYEFLNYYDPGYAAPADALAVVTSLTEANANIGEPYRLQIGVTSPKPASMRPSMSITLVVDTSLSMAGHAIQNARFVLADIASSLKPGDKVSLVTLDAYAAPLVEGQVIPPDGDTSAVTKQFEGIKVGGSSDLQGGLVRAYSLAQKYAEPPALSRVVLITDGRTNPSSVDMGFVGEYAKKGDDDGILLVGVATGPAEGYDDRLLNQLTDNGRGAYIYIDKKEESKKIFADHFREVMEIAARSVSVEITLPGYFTLQKFYGESSSTSDAPPEPQHLAPGDTMIFNMKLDSSCAINPNNAQHPIDILVQWKTPFDLTDRSAKVTEYVGPLLQGSSPQIMKSNAIISYAEALKSLDKMRLQRAYTELGDALKQLPNGDPELEEIETNLLNHPLLKP